MRIRHVACVAGIVVSLLVGGVSQAASARPRTSRSYCPVHFVAHRGEGWPRPNTQDSSDAIRAAIEDPDAYGVESDVWATSDGRGLMQHADELSVSTDGKGKVSGHTLAYIQTHFTMNDGTKPESMSGYLQQVVAARQHAILHVKSSSLDALVNRALTTAHAHRYVRPMATSLSQAEYFVGRGWHTELLVHGPATAAQVAAIRAARVTAVLVVDPSGTTTPGNWIQPYIAAGVSTDYVTYSAVQNKLITKYALNRVLSPNIAVTAAEAHCPATAK